MTQINGYEVMGRTPLFTCENRALVRSGVKTQTRRVMKVQPEQEWTLALVLDDGRAVFDVRAGYDVKYIKCPYGATGDIRVMPEPLFNNSGLAFYQTHHIAPVVINDNHIVWNWKVNTLSSMFMPIWAGRTFVRYTRLWAERLQDISAKDALAEGWPGRTDATCLTIKALGSRSITGLAAIDWYAALWDSINGKTYPWKNNDWVWCIEWELL